MIQFAGLDEVRLCPSLQSFHSISRKSQSRIKQNRSLVIEGANPPAQLNSSIVITGVLTQQAEIEMLRASQPQAPGQRGANDDLVASFAEKLCHRFFRIFVPFDVENACRAHKSLF